MSLPLFGIQRCKKCGELVIARLWLKSKICPKCGHRWLLHPKRRHTLQLCLNTAHTLDEAREKLKKIKMGIEK